MKTLNEDIEELNAILSQHKVKNWKVPKVSSKSRGANVLQMYGGMGSINDLYISKVNGHCISVNQEAEVNQKVHDLLSRIYDKCIAYEK